MSEVSENEVNVKDFKIQLINTLIHYYNKNKNKKRITDTTSLRINPNVYQKYVEVIQNLGFCSYRNIGIITEALMNMVVENLKNHPKIVQTTLFYKPEINIQQKNVEVNIAQKLELKLVIKDLFNVLDVLENRKGNKEFYISKLREVLPKALRVYEKTESRELQELLVKAEKWV